jgi:hypothetical protein
MKRMDVRLVPGSAPMTRPETERGGGQSRRTEKDATLEVSSISFRRDSEDGSPALGSEGTGD